MIPEEFLMPIAQLDGCEITDELKDQWLKERKPRLGASEAAVAIGLPGFTSRLQLFLRKTGQLPDSYDQADPVSQRRMRWGLRHEPTIAQAYLDECGGNWIASQLFCIAKTHDFMCATLDRVHSSGKVVELKTTGENNAKDWGESGTDEIPHVYLVQVLHQLHCANLTVADVAVLIGSADFRVFTIERKRNEKALERIVTLEDEFMRAVRSGRPPVLDPEKDAGLLAYLWPDELDAPAVQFNDRQDMAWAAYEDMGKQIGLLTKEREVAKLIFAEAMGNHTRATLGDGRTLTRKVVSVEERCQMVKAHSYPLFRIERPRKK